MADTFKDEDPPTLKLRIALVGDLNRLLGDPSFYDAQRFAAVHLGSDLQAEAKKLSPLPQAGEGRG